VKYSVFYELPPTTPFSVLIYVREKENKRKVLDGPSTIARSAPLQKKKKKQKKKSFIPHGANKRERKEEIRARE
jgi:hypothetical protein